MKRKYLRTIRRTSLFLMTIGLFLVSSIDAQVTIGSLEKPVTGSLLQLKNLDTDSKGVNSNKGLGLPRVMLSKKDALFPMFLIDPADPASGGESDYLQDKNNIDKKHTGLLVYNTIANYEEDLCLGLNYWNGSSWQCMMPSIPAEYTVECGDIEVEGLYYRNEPLDGEVNRIKITLTNIPKSAYGSVAKLETNTVDGISFKGEKRLLNPTEVIYLEGEGMTTNYEVKEMTITSNSISETAISCKVTVVIVIPPQRLMTLGNENADYGYNLGLLTSRRAANGFTSGNDLLTDSDNFGYHPWSIVKFAGFKNMPGTNVFANMPGGNISTNVNTWVDDNRDIVALHTIQWQNMTAATLKNFLEGTNGKRKVDVFMIGFDTEFFRDNNAGDKARCEVLIEYVKKGGILMICSEATASNGNFMRLFFNKSDIGSASGAGAGSLYTLGFDTSDTTPEHALMRPYYCKDDDPILAGPFENILGKTWGEDASDTRYITNLPVEELVIYSGGREIGNTSRPANSVTIFRHKEYPFVFIGDGGFNSNEWRTYDGRGVCPFRLTEKVVNGHTYKSYPISRDYGAPGGKAYNAVFTANAFAWCIEKAEELKEQQEGN